MKSRRIPFTLLLPLMSLAMLVTLVALPVTMAYLNLHDPQVRRNLDQFVPVPNSEARMLRFAASIESSRIADFINGIDVPANFIELPIDRLLPAWPDTWHPQGFTVFSWRALTFPIYSLPFWWLAGFGIDSLSQRRHPRWPALLGGTIVFAAWATVCIGLTITMDVDDLHTANVEHPIMFGLWTWTILLAAFPLAWLANARG